MKGVDAWGLTVSRGTLHAHVTSGWRWLLEAATYQRAHIDPRVEDSETAIAQLHRGKVVVVSAGAHTRRPRIDRPGSRQTEGGWA